MSELPEPRTVETAYLAAILAELRGIRAVLAPTPVVTVGVGEAESVPIKVIRRSKRQ